MEVKNRSSQAGIAWALIRRAGGLVDHSEHFEGTERDGRQELGRRGREGSKGGRGCFAQTLYILTVLCDGAIDAQSLAGLVVPSHSLHVKLSRR
jgi:hypothetical protein